MRVKNGLAGAGTAVHADVEAGDGRVFGQKFFAQKQEQRLCVPSLPGRQGEPVGGVAEGDDEQMTIGDRKAIRHGKHAAMFGDESLPELGIAEGARDIVVHGLSRNFLRCQAGASLADHRSHSPGAVMGRPVSVGKNPGTLASRASNPEVITL